MTLKEKFLPFVDDIDLINDIPSKEWSLRNANKCEQIADDYAIEFAEWVNINFFVYNTWEERKSIKQLLEIFKKEKEI